MKNKSGEMVLHETVYMQLSRHVREIGIRLLQGAGFTLEWWLTRSDGALFRHVTGISSEAELIEFSTLDPYAERLRNDYDVILEKYATASAPIEDAGNSSLNDQVGELIEAIEKVSVCTTESELIDAVRRLAIALGCDRFIYQWICFGARSESPADAVETHYFSSSPVGLPEYIDRAWYMNDPYVQHAWEDARPMVIAAAQIQPNHWLIAEERRHGFGKGIVMPCHRFRGDGTKLVGLLHLCIAEARSQEEGERELWHRRSLILILCYELMEWRVERIRQRALVDFRLTEEEVRVLQIIKMGGNARIVATELGVALNKVNKTIYRRIKLKMGVKTISEAVGKASSVGLFNRKIYHFDDP